MMTMGIVAVTLATFFSEKIVTLLLFSAVSEAWFVFSGLFCGGLASGVGIMVAVVGLLRKGGGVDVRLGPSLLALSLSIILFFALIFASITSPVMPPLRPGETVTI
jgi:hypothetical protein